VVPENIRTTPTEGILGGGGFSKAQNLKLMYKALLEFPERWASGVLRKNPFRGGGMDIFWNQTLTL